MLPHRRASLSCLFVYLFINNSELQVPSIIHADIVLSNLFLLRHFPDEPVCISCQNRADPETKPAHQVHFVCHNSTRILYNTL